MNEENQIESINREYNLLLDAIYNFRNQSKRMPLEVKKELEAAIDYILASQELLQKVQEIQLNKVVGHKIEEYQRVQQLLDDLFNNSGELNAIGYTIKKYASLLKDGEFKSKLLLLGQMVVDHNISVDDINTLADNMENLSAPLQDVQNKLQDLINTTYRDSFGSNALPPSSIANTTPLPTAATVEDYSQQIEALLNDVRQHCDEARAKNEEAKQELEKYSATTRELLANVNNMRTTVSTMTSSQTQEDFVQKLYNVNTQALDMIRSFGAMLDSNEIDDVPIGLPLQSLLDFGEQTSSALTAVLQGNEIDIDSLVNELNSRISELPTALKKYSQTVYDSESYRLRMEQKRLSRQLKNINARENGELADVSALEETSIKYINSMSNDMGAQELFNAAHMIEQNHGARFVNWKTDSAQYGQRVMNVAHRLAVGEAIFKDFSEDASKRGGYIHQLYRQKRLERMSTNANILGRDQIDILKGIDYNRLSRKFFTKEDKKSLELIEKSAQRSLEHINKLIAAFDIADADISKLEALKHTRDILAGHIDRLNRLDKSTKEMSISLNDLRRFKNKIVGVLRSALSLFGVGSILSPFSVLRSVMDQYTKNGRMMYKLSATSGAMGLDVNTANNRYMLYDIGNYYHELTNGAIGFYDTANLYMNFAKNVGSQLGEGFSTKTREDLQYMAAQLMPHKAMYDMSDKKMADMILAFYRDNRMSAHDVVNEFKKLEAISHSANIPVAKLLDEMTQLVNIMRNLGVSARVTRNVVYSMAGYNNLRLEDSTALFKETVSASTKLSKDYGRNIFWGIMTGETKDPFGMLVDTQISHFADGTVNEEYYDKLTDRLFKETDFHTNRWGGVNTNMGGMEMYATLIKQGYTQKQASILVNLAREGKWEEVKRKLKGYDEANREGSDTEQTQDMATNLARASEQYATTEKIKQDYARFIQKSAQIVDVQMGGLLSNASQFFRDLLPKYTEVMVSLIQKVGGFFASPIGKFLMENFEEHPFLTGGAVLGLGGLATEGVKGILKAPLNLARGKGFGMMSGRAGLATAGTMMLLTSLAAYLYNRDKGDDVAEASGNATSWSNIAQLLESGDVKVNILDASGKQGQQVIDTLFMGAAAVYVPFKAGMWVYSHKLRNFIRNRPSEFYRAARRHNLRNARLSNTQEGKELAKENLRKLREYKQNRKQYREQLNKYRERRNLFRKTEWFRRHGKGLATAMLFETFGGDESMSVEDRMKTAGGSYIVGATAEWATKLALLKLTGGKHAKAVDMASSAIGIGAQYFSHDLIAQLFGGNQEESIGEDGLTPTFGRNTQELSNAYSNVAQQLGLSNKQFNSMIDQSMSKHHIEWDKVSTEHKAMWMQKFLEYSQIFGDMDKALVAASQATANVIQLSNKKDLGNGLVLENGKVKVSDAVRKDLHKKYSQEWSSWVNVNDSRNAEVLKRRSDFYGQLSEKETDENKQSLYLNLGLYYDALANQHDWSQHEATHEMAYEIQQKILRSYSGESNSLDDYWRSLYDKYYSTLYVRPTEQNFQLHNIREFLQTLAEKAETGELEGVQNIQQYYIKSHVESDISSIEEQAQEAYNPIRKDGSGIIDIGSGGSGEGTYWIKQTDDVSYEGAHQETMQALDALARWFYEKTGRPLVVTAVTNGSSHQDGDRSHYAGWKFDVNDWGSGAEGTLLGLEGENTKGTLTDEFIRYGQSLGLGMNWEGDHIDVSTLGDQWEGEYAGHNFGGFRTPNQLPQSMQRPMPQSKPNIELKKTTIQDEIKQNQENYKNIMKGMGFATGDSVQGRIVNGLYVDTSKQWESIEDVKKRIGVDEEAYTNLRAVEIASPNDTESNLNAIAERVERDYKINPEEFEPKKNWVFVKAMQAIDALVNEYMIEPVIATNVIYKDKEKK